MPMNSESNINSGVKGKNGNALQKSMPEFALIAVVSWDSSAVNVNLVDADKAMNKIPLKCKDFSCISGGFDCFGMILTYRRTRGQS